MQRRSLSCFVSLLALFFVLFLQLGSKADTLNRAATNGRYLLDGVNLTQFNVSVYKSYSTATGRTILWGTLGVVSNKFVVTTTVLSEDYSYVSISGTSCKHAVIISNTFNFMDPNTLIRVPAHMIIELTQFGLNGQGGIKILRDSDNTVMTQSSFSNSNYAELPFSTGSVTITM